MQGISRERTHLGAAIGASPIAFGTFRILKAAMRTEEFATATPRTSREGVYAPPESMAPSLARFLSSPDSGLKGYMISVMTCF